MLEVRDATYNEDGTCFHQLRADLACSKIGSDAIQVLPKGVLLNDAHYEDVDEQHVVFSHKGSVYTAQVSRFRNACLTYGAFGETPMDRVKFLSRHKSRPIF